MIIGPLPDESTGRGIHLALRSRMTYYIAMAITELRGERNDCQQPNALAKINKNTTYRTIIAAGIYCRRAIPVFRGYAIAAPAFSTDNPTVNTRWVHGNVTSRKLSTSGFLRQTSVSLRTVGLPLTGTDKIRVFSLQRKELALDYEKRRKINLVIRSDHYTEINDNNI